ncbi:MAG: GGDEF domain-containing protein [Caryophanon sp.]|nr:GGDEF domain-containing protein [Caryophanon sp.]
MKKYDFLKSLNDVHGHVVGDYAICKVAEVLTISTASFGFAGRIGGDEFVVFLNVSSMSMSIEQWIAQIVKRYQQAMQHIDDVPLSLSVGVSYVGQDGETLEQLLDVADVRMYDMKRQNKEKHSFSSR